MKTKVNLDKNTKREYVKLMFNSISKSYDLLNHLLSFGIDIYWRKKALKKHYFYPDAICLDLAAGTGDFGLQAYKLFNIKVIGYDLAVNSLHLFQKKITQKKLSEHFTYINGEAEKLCLIDDSINLVTIAFGIRNFYDPKTSLEEIYRVLKTGGALNILEFSLPKNLIIRTIYLLYFNHILPFIGKIISKNKTAYNYLPNSVEEFDKKDNLVSLLIEANFRNIEIYKFTFGVVKNYIAYKK